MRTIVRKEPRTSKPAALATRFALPLMLLLALLTAIPAICQRARPGTGPGATKAPGWAALQNEKPTIVGSLIMGDCNEYPSIPCREYLIQALAYHWKMLHPEELKITDLDHHMLILMDRDVDSFLYMLPLAPNSVSSSAGLLATAWTSADDGFGAKVYLLHGDGAKAVFYNGSQFSPQFIEASESIPNPFVLLDRSDQTGAIARPTRTEIWEWDPAAKKFILRTTVPVAQKFMALARILWAERRNEGPTCRPTAATSRIHWCRTNRCFAGGARCGFGDACELPVILGSLNSPQQLVVICVRANPKPGDATFA